MSSQTEIYFSLEMVWNLKIICHFGRPAMAMGLAKKTALIYGPLVGQTNYKIMKLNAKSM